jgi:hypothetical protein
MRVLACDPGDAPAVHLLARAPRRCAVAGRPAVGVGARGALARDKVPVSIATSHITCARPPRCPALAHAIRGRKSPAMSAGRSPCR